MVSNTQPNQFVFICCQVGAEAALKKDLQREHPNFKFAFSRPGFLTFKCTDAETPEVIRSPFARCFGTTLGYIKSADTLQEEAVAIIREFVSSTPAKHLHIWRRDRCLPGDRQFEPFIDPELTELGQQIVTAVGGDFERATVNQRVKPNDTVVDLIVVDDDHWFLAHHQATSIARCWPGGIPLTKKPDEMVSRAYLKMEEALRWSRLPIQRSDLCVELGSSPGGSCQCLLERGLKVIGIDPAKMDERVLNHPNFTHVRARAGDLKRKEFADVRWLMTDANNAPETTLDDIEHIVTNRRVNIHGMLITLKLLDSEKVEHLESHLARIRNWGYRYVRARQLAFNRREICVLAARSKGKLRIGSIAKNRKNTDS